MMHVAMAMLMNIIKFPQQSAPMAFTPTARPLWEKIPPHVRQSMLANVWCGQCRDAVSIEHIKARVEKGSLVLAGKCENCGGNVARLIECDG